MPTSDAFASHYSPIQGRYKPIESLVHSLGGAMSFRTKGGIEGSYRIDLYGRSLVVQPRATYSNDFDTLLESDDTLKPDAFWILVRLFEQHGVPHISDAPTGEPWEEGRSEWQRRGWLEFWAALRGVDAPYPECNGYTLAELVCIWHGSPGHTPPAMNMRIFLARCRERSGQT